MGMVFIEGMNITWFKGVIINSKNIIKYSNL
jgi:hypothetical protein